MITNDVKVVEGIESKVLNPSPGRLAKSLRDTGYTFNTAVADIVDNSVAAGASQIRLSLQLEFGGKPVLMIADNGCGMDPSAGEAAMMYGSPLRPNPKSLGKFGMGLKTASTSFCTKLTLISSKDGVYTLLQWDLDIIERLDEWVMIEPLREDYQEQIDFLEETTNGGNGTLVIWENIDRLVRSDTDGTTKAQLDKIRAELNDHLSGVFYNFLEKEENLPQKKDSNYPDISISINDKPVEPWDPFCRWLNKDNETRVEIHKHKPFYITRVIDAVDTPIGTFNVNVYILPNKTDLSEAELTRMRYGLDNQGFHVFREGRMISSGGWLNRLFVKEPHMNLIRVELTFDHKLDDYFQIDIKKSRIDLPKDVRETLRKKITPARNEANRRYRTGGRPADKDGTTLGSRHNQSSTAIEKHTNSTTANSKVHSVDKEKGEAQITNKYGNTKIKLLFDDTNDKVVISTPTLQDAALWQPGLVEGNKHAVFLNESHEFYKRFYYANKNNAALVLAMDSLLWSLAEAELSVLNDAVKRNLEDLRINVSRSLRTLAEELPDVDSSENDNKGGEQ